MRFETIFLAIAIIATALAAPFNPSKPPSIRSYTTKFWLTSISGAVNDMESADTEGHLT